VPEAHEALPGSAAPGTTLGSLRAPHAALIPDSVARQAALPEINLFICLIVVAKTYICYN